ncbi:hypothetical protein BKA66DRAFT_439263 [Pyrenochaeta sp. MPI-SDFR-AT-0127]|nr:hypothetical protein BKA66DRAFT_439263 [Pyrenochaeta sp. MPI-SDFR-AT-0127]
MAFTPPAQNAPNSSSPLITPEHAEAATICCSVFEQSVVPDLCRGHERADPKLTLSERSRITNTFFLAWRILLATQFNDLPIAQEHVKGLSPADLLYVREVALFMCNNVRDTQHDEIKKLMGYTANGNVWEKWINLLTATHACFQDVGMSIHQPDYAPLGLGLLFDDWKETYVDTQVEAYQKLLN